MMKEITLVDNQYIVITNLYQDGQLIMTSRKPTKPISEWTPNYEKHVAYWKKFADKITHKKSA